MLQGTDVPLRPDARIATQVDHSSICWACGVSDPTVPRCEACGSLTGSITPIPRRFIGGVFPVKRRLRTREGLAVGEHASAALVLVDGSVEQVLLSKLGDPIRPPAGSAHARSAAWSLVVGSRTISPTDEASFNQLVATYALTLAEASEEHRRLFAFDALEASCPGWLERLSLTGSERDWLLGSHEAHAGNVAAGLMRILRLPPDRYGPKDRVILRCWPAVAQDETLLAPVLRQLEPFRYTRPIADVLCRRIEGEAVPDGLWVDVLRALRSGAASDPATEAEDLIETISRGELPLSARFDLGAPAAQWALSAAIQAGVQPPTLDAAAIRGLSTSLLDDAIDVGALDPAALATLGEEQRRYGQARVDPVSLQDADLEAIGFNDERARRAYERGDRATLEQLPQSPATRRLLALDALKRGDVALAHRSMDDFPVEQLEVLRSLLTCLESGSVAAADKRLLQDGTAWPLIVGLLPEEPAALAELAVREPSIHDLAAWGILSAATDRLFAWDWEGALEAAKGCLRVSRDEEIRDEALNLLAAARWQLGDDDAAFHALNEAIDGRYTEGLQVNMGVVAGFVDPQVAAEHLGRLANTAPTLALRASAAERALTLWFAASEPWETDDDGEETLPSTLRGSLRALVRNDIPQQTFIRFAKALARWDSDWFGDDSSLAGAPYAGSDEARAFQAKARAFPEFVKELASVIGEDPESAWATEEGKELVAMALGTLMTDDPPIGAAFFGLELVDSGIPMPPLERIRISAFAIDAIADAIDPAEGEPKEEFLDTLIARQADVAEVPEADRDTAWEIFQYGLRRFTGVTLISRSRQLDDAIEMYNSINSQLYGVPRSQINMSAVRSGTQPAVEFLGDTNRLVRKMLSHLASGEFRDSVEAFLKDVARIGTAYRELRGGS
jgi:hypothetical protein